MNYSYIDLDTIRDNFLDELIAAQNRAESSLSFINNQIPQASLAKTGEIFQVMTIGGSFGHNVLIKKEDNHFSILKSEETTLPTFESKEILLDYVSSKLNQDVKIVAINFAYPLKPVFEGDRLDSILIRATKEHQFKGLIGEKVGQAIQEYIQSRFSREIIASVANDTVCMLLSGLTKYSPENLAGIIVGTGVNAAFFNNNHQIINLEAGNFNKLAQTEEGKKIDSASIYPGSYLLEKEVAGAYLYKHFNLIIEKLGLQYPQLDSSKQLTDAYNSSNPEIAKIAKAVLTNSAMLVACIASALLEYRKKDLVFVTEGNLFWKAPNYREMVVEFTKKLSPKQRAEFIYIENSNILGGAKLVG